MSNERPFLHSHSGLERRHRDLVNNKLYVLVDKEFVHLFSFYIPFKYNGVQYYRVPTYEFVKRGGVFKNLEK